MFRQTKKWLEKKEFKYEEINGIKYPTKDTIMYIHDFLIESFIKEGELAHRGLLTDAQLSFEGIQSYQEEKENKQEDIILRGAHIFNQFLQAGHPFIDGNKRTGFVTLWFFLLLNGFTLKVSSWSYKNHLKKFNRWAVATESDNIDEIVRWIKENAMWKEERKNKN